MKETTMNATTHDKVALPAPGEKQAATEGQRALAAYLSTQSDTQLIQITSTDGQLHPIELPTSALRLLQEVLAELALGNAVKVVPVHAELTTQEAADLLNVSRPYVVQLMESGQLPFHKAGTHRRVKFADLQAYKAQRDQTSANAMSDLGALDQELGMGY